MELRPMKYKDFVWPHNPKIYEISFERRIAVSKVPFGEYVMRDMGRTYRVLRGEGEFFGDDAYGQFRRLASVFYEGGSGKLWHPLWQESDAYFTSLTLKQEPRADYVYYTFEFWENTSDGGTVKTVGASSAAEGASDADAAVKTHTVVAGDTMWAIAKKYGLTLSQLIALNPQIKNPNIILTGQSINIS